MGKTLKVGFLKWIYTARAVVHLHFEMEANLPFPEFAICKNGNALWQLGVRGKHKQTKNENKRR